MHHQSTCIYSTTTLHQEVQLLKWSTVNPFDKQQHQVHQPVLNPVIAWCTRHAPIASQTAPKLIYITKLVLPYNQVVLLLHHKCTAATATSSAPSHVSVNHGDNQHLLHKLIALYTASIYLCTKCTGAPQNAPNAPSADVHPKSASKVCMVELAS